MDNCVILDDDTASIKVLSHYIERTKSLKLLASFSDAIDGLNYLVENREKIDLLFLDIEMPEMNGFEILKHSQYTGALFQQIMKMLLRPLKQRLVFICPSHLVILNF